MTINPNTRLTQVKTALLNYITRNQLKRNDQMPSEAAIAKTLGVSRNTLREAYISLENEGVIVRRHGIGTFIAQSPVIQDSLNDFFPFAQIIQDGGYTPNFKTLSNEFIIAPEDVCEVFKLPSDAAVRCINRLVKADEQPVILVADYISPLIEGNQIDWEKFDGNMVNFLSANVGTPLHQIQSKIRAAAVTTETTTFLKLAVGTPILSVRSIIYAVDNSPVTFSKICFNSNIVELNTVRTIRSN